MSDLKPCPRCGGTREIRWKELSPMGHPMSIVDNCPACAAPTPVAAYREVTLDELTALVKEAMQDGWNDICIDSGHHPSDIKQCGRRELEFRAGQWASSAASFLMLSFKRENIGAIIPEASREPGQPWDGVGAYKQPEPPRE